MMMMGSLGGHAANSQDNAADMPIADPANICTHCQDIDFDYEFDTTLFKRRRFPRKLPRSAHIENLLDQERWKGDCPLCRFFRDMAGPSATSAFLRSVWPHLRTDERGSAFLAILPEGQNPQALPAVIYLDRADDDGLAGYQSDRNGIACGRMVPPLCDFTVARNWMLLCTTNHGKACESSLEPVTGLRVIDCHRRAVVCLPEKADYVTLSYVWGIPQSEDIDSRTALPAHLPAVVSDAMEVARRMGLNYIWIDRYCIPQDDMAERQRQIQLMGQIYINSWLTIIDATGSDAGSGLAGMSFPRRRQPRIQVGGYRLVSTLSPATLEIQESPWATRGWTYQEGHLARRRLVFTPQQIYFQCQRAHSFESTAVFFPRSLDEQVPPWLFQPYFAAKYWDRIENWRSKYGGTKLLADGIMTYMARALTFPSDRLAAFAAMLRQYKTTTDGVFRGHLLGVPLVSPSFGDHSNSSRTQQLLVGLSWYMDGARAEHQWPLTYSCFPSWSWVAWWWSPVGARFVFDFGATREITEMSSDTLSSWVAVSVKFRGGDVVPWETGKDQIDGKIDGSVNSIECLRFDAWTFEVGVEALPVSITVNGPTDNVVLQEYQLKGLIIGYRTFRGRITTLIALECGQSKEDNHGQWRRVSHGQLYLGLRDKKNPIKYHSNNKATVAAKIIPWRKWKSGRVKLKREVLDLY